MQSLMRFISGGAGSHCCGEDHCQAECAVPLSIFKVAPQMQSVSPLPAFHQATACCCFKLPSRSGSWDSRHLQEAVMCRSNQWTFKAGPQEILACRRHSSMPVEQRHLRWLHCAHFTCKGRAPAAEGSNPAAGSPGEGNPAGDSLEGGTLEAGSPEAGSPVAGSRGDPAAGVGTPGRALRMGCRRGQACSRARGRAAAAGPWRPSERQGPAERVHAQRWSAKSGLASAGRQCCVLKKGPSSNINA